MLQIVTHILNILKIARSYNKQNLVFGFFCLVLFETAFLCVALELVLDLVP